ncbi:uncharacterized protein [Palaemon carinicauda]|uniref:uncharacterized protein n=1 Tax=Palaemon carinicauda TaxID=392227 RepID=UPI0035B5AD33
MRSSKRPVPVMIGSKDGGSNTNISSCPSNNSPSKHLGRSSSVPTERPAPTVTKSQKPAEKSFNTSPLHLVKSASTSTLTSATNTSTSSNSNTHRTRASSNAKELPTDSNIKDELYEKAIFHAVKVRRPIKPPLPTSCVF